MNKTDEKELRPSTADQPAPTDDRPHEIGEPDGRVEETGDAPPLAPDGSTAEHASLTPLSPAEDPDDWVVAYPEEFRDVIREYGVPPEQHPASEYINTHVMLHVLFAFEQDARYAVEEIDAEELRAIIDGVIAELSAEEHVDPDEEFPGSWYPDYDWTVTPRGLECKIFVGPHRRLTDFVIERERLLEEWPGEPGVSAWLRRLAEKPWVWDLGALCESLRDTIRVHYPNQHVIDLIASREFAAPVWARVQSGETDQDDFAPPRAFLPRGAYAVVRGPIDAPTLSKLNALLDQVRALGIDVVDRRDIEREDPESAMAGWRACVLDRLRDKARSLIGETERAATAAGRPRGFALDDVLIDYDADEDRVGEVLDLIGRGDEFERLRLEAYGEFEKPKPPRSSVH